MSNDNSEVDVDDADPFGLGKKPAGKASRIVLSDPNLFIGQVNLGSNQYQHERELVMNSLDAKATEIHITPDWVEVGRSGTYRYTIIDNGCGMSRDDLHERSRLLIETNRPDHFGVGGRISTLPLSPLGVVYMSCQDGQWNMIRLWRDPVDNYPKFFTWETDTNGSTEVVEDIPDEYKKMARDHGIKDGHGTMVILIGEKADQDTFRDLVRGEDGEFVGGARTHTVVLNTRFADVQKLAPGVSISCVEFSSTDKSKWPRTYEKRHTPTDVGGDGKKKLLMSRGIRGFLPYIRDLAEKTGVSTVSTKYNGKDCLANVHWFIFYDADKIPDHVPNKDPHAFLGGEHRATTAIILKDELYSLDNHPERLRKYGLYVQGSQLHKKLAIFIEPHEGTAHNDFSRSHVRWDYRPGDDGMGPQYEWAQAFKANLPAPLRELKDEALNTLTGASNIEDMLRDELTPLLEAYLAQRLIHGRGLRKRRGPKKDPWPPSQGDGTSEPPPPPQDNGDDVVDIIVKDKEKFIPQIKWAHMGEDQLASNYDPENRLLLLNADFPMFTEYKTRFLEAKGENLAERLIVKAVEDAYARRIGSAYVVGYFRHKHAKHVDNDMLKKLISDEAGTLVACDVLGMHDAIELMLKKSPFKAAKKSRAG